MNPAQAAELHALPSGVHSPALVSATVRELIPRKTGTEPEWIGCDLSSYRLRLAETEADRLAACRLRFRVFNLELGEGLSESYASGIDQDAFDEVCEHLLVEEKQTGRIVGTYRMQSGLTAWRKLGYYSEQEFDLAPYEALRPEILELGRACIEREHRLRSEVLLLLWRGISQYAQHNRFRYLIGCSSVNSQGVNSQGTSQDPAAGWAIYHQLAPFLVDPALRTVPTAAYTLPTPLSDSVVLELKVPKLLRTYLAVGSRICSEPAWDRSFGTIDFLTLQDMEQLTPAARSRFLCRQ